MTQLSRLTHLDVSFNELTGDCPAPIGAMTDLTYLFLGDNDLSIAAGVIPEHLQSLTKLRELSLGNLNLQGTLPIWLDDFKDLRLFDLAQNQLTGSIGLNFAKLPRMVALMLHDNQLNGTLPQSLSLLQDLTVLSLHHNDFLDESSTAEMVCNSSSGPELMTIDCGAMECPCCGDCCDSDDCVDGIVWETLEHADGQWEQNFERSDYSFNPHITLTGRRLRWDATGIVNRQAL